MFKDLLNNLSDFLILTWLTYNIGLHVIYDKITTK